MSDQPQKMRKRRSISHPEHDHEEGEPWLVSYADMMTLLFGFFVLMYTFAAAKSIDEDVMILLRRELAEYFGGTFSSEYDTLLDTYRLRVNTLKLSDGFESRTTPEGLEITFQSAFLFQSGSATLTTRAEAALDVLAEVLGESGDSFTIVVEGHTDNVPVSESNDFRSNWELSGSRAARVAEIFEHSGLAGGRMRILGFADTQPKVPNQKADGTPIPANQAQNRRVKIAILKAESSESGKILPGGSSRSDDD